MSLSASVPLGRLFDLASSEINKPEYYDSTDRLTVTRDGVSKNAIESCSSIDDVHDFYSPEEAKRYGYENKTIYVDQRFLVKDKAGCIVRLTTVVRTSFQFKNGVQTNHKSVRIVP